MIFNYDLCVNPSLLKDSATAVLSTILFHRLLGTIVPSTREIFANVPISSDHQRASSNPNTRSSSNAGQNPSSYTHTAKPSYALAYPCVADPDIDASIDDQIRKLVDRFQRSSSVPFNNTESSQMHGNRPMSSNLLYTLSVIFTSENKADVTNLGEWVQNEQGKDVWCWERWNINCFGKFLIKLWN